MFLTRASAYTLPLLLWGSLVWAAVDAEPELHLRWDGFERTPCPFRVPPAAAEADRLICGSVMAPEAHADPEGPTVRLPVAVFRSMHRAPRPDPLVMLAGGPGESTFESYVEGISSPIAEVFLAQRDIVLIELSGLHYSEPALSCDEVPAAMKKSLALPVAAGASLELQRRAVAACRDRLTASGIDLSAYHSVENAADIALVMNALGYERFNLYANSAGTLLAQHLMRDYGERLRRVVIGSVVPLSLGFVQQMPSNAARALQRVFTRCESEPSCRERHPDSEERFLRLVDALDAEPARLTLRDPSSGGPMDVLLTGGRLSQIVFTLLYSTEATLRLPELLDRLEARDFVALEEELGGRPVIATLLPPPTFSWGMYYSVMCAEDADFAVEDIAVDGQYAPFKQAAAELWFGPRRLLAMCPIWDVERLQAYVNAPVVSDVPTLLLSGALDNVTPPHYADSVAETLSRAYAYTYPDVGHSPISGGLCPLIMMAEFVGDPVRTPDARCIEGMEGEALIPLASILLPEDGRGIFPDPFATRLALLLASTLLLLSALVIWPLDAWRRSEALGGAVRLARWTAGSAAGLELLSLALFFLFGPMLLFAIVFINDESARMVAGYPLALQIAAWLPLPALLAGLVALVFATRAWIEPGWRLVGRLYYTLVVAAILLFAWYTIVPLLASLA